MTKYFPKCLIIIIIYNFNGYIQQPRVIKTGETSAMHVNSKY